MDPKWSNRNRSSRDEKTPRLEHSIHTRASRPGPKESVTSAQLKTKHGTNPARESYGTEIVTDLRDVMSSSDERASEKEGLPTGNSMNRYGIAPQAPDNGPQVSGCRSCIQRSRIVDGMPQVGLAVIGTPGSGKSTFVQHALDLKKCSKASPSTKKVSLEGVVSLLRIHEFNILDVDITPEGLPKWPHMSGQGTPRQIDGVIMVYSINDSSSTSPIPRLLRSLNAISNGPLQYGVARGQETARLLDNIDGDGLTWHNEDDGLRHAVDSQNDVALKTDTIEMPKKGSRATGFVFDELVDRLLSQAMSKTDDRFAAIFLCLYRAFAAPSTLLAALISRFDDVNGGKNPSAIRTAAQLRYLSVLARWISQYPGDFAHPGTRANLADFIAGLGGQRAFAMVIKEINIYLDVVLKDDDTAWACSDKRQNRTDTTEALPSLSPAQSTPSTSRTRTPSENADSTDHLSENALHSSERGSATPSAASVGKSSTHSNGLVQGLSMPVNSAQDQARLLTPFPRTSLSKAHWHLFMRVSDEDIAQELTRIDWIMFSSIRPRDLVKYVSLCEIDKESCRSMENITRLIDQFNHVAFWIANIILLRDKPKHRAKALEKCMAIAWASNCRLRQLNNYNSLGAVVAGINGTAVHRLYETRELVPHHVQKQFMRLEILMSTQKSHFAYRLAWSNTSAERIPFLPLHSRDLASAEEGNPTYLDEESKCINWKKFEIIGDVIISVQRSQATPYTNISRNEEVQRLILECQITKDEDVSMVLD
ncbi:MAG: hypothetical protein Q9200_000955 [Gallowayella weberi]